MSTSNPSPSSSFGQMGNEKEDNASEDTGKVCIKNYDEEETTGKVESPIAPKDRDLKDWVLVQRLSNNEDEEAAKLQAPVAPVAPKDRELTLGVFVGDSERAEEPVKDDEGFKMYEGPLPKDRDPKFWGLYGDHTGNAWMKYITEKNVFNKLLRHYTQEGQKDWEIGIGKGGQLYSWRLFTYLGNEAAEVIPPQFLPWNDEVWQATAHSTEVQWMIDAIRHYDKNESNLHGTVGEAFVHGSAGCDRNAPPGKAVFWAPPLADWYDPTSKTYTICNWGTNGSLPTCFYHKILYYNKYRYIGDGVLEVTSLAYNFGKYGYLYGGIPWGGVRTSNFPELFITDVGDDSEHFVDAYYGEDGCGKESHKTGGYIGATATKDDPKSRTFGFVFGKDYPYEKIQKGDPRRALTSFGRAGRTPDGKPNSRDFTVMATSVRGMQNPGENYWIRYYIAINTTEKVVEKAKALQRKADYGVLNFTEDTATLQPLYRIQVKGGVILARTGAKGDKPVCRVYNEPVLHSMPLFFVRELPAGLITVTTDPYELCHKEPWKNPVPEGQKYHKELENVKKCRPYQSQAGNHLKWELLGFVIPAEKAKAEPEGYLNLESIVDSPGTKGMLAVGCIDLDYSNIKVTKLTDTTKALEVKVTVDAKNAGGTHGIAAPRLYVKDIEASVPVVDNKAVGGKNVLLQAGETKSIEFKLNADDFSLIDNSGYHLVEPGEFSIKIGRNRNDILLEDKLKVDSRIVIKQDPRYKPPPPIIEGSPTKPDGLGLDLALGTKVKVSSFYGPGYEPEHAVDGNPITQWASHIEGTNTWLEIPLGKSYRVTHFGYKSRLGSDHVSRFILTFSDGSVQIGKMNEGSKDDFQYFGIKEVVTDTVHWKVDTGGALAGGYEFSVYGVAAD